MASANTPVIVGAGQHVEREAGASSPAEIASRAARAALDSCGGNGVGDAIDTIAAIRIFPDSGKMWRSDFGRCDNLPQSIAARVGVAPSSRIYSEAGGNQPQSLLIEFFRDLHAGRRSAVLLVGSEAILNQRAAQRSDRTLDWNETFDEPLEDRGFGSFVSGDQERYNGLVMPVYYYMLMDEYRRQTLGLSREDYMRRSAELLEPFSRVAADNPHAQFPGAMTAAEIAGAEPMTHLYTKRMVARDGVNQGAALLLTTLGKARELGIAESNLVFMHGAAEGSDVEMSLRPDPSRSAMASAVADRALGMAGKAVADISLIDIYSCFPVAVTAVADHLGLPTDGSRPLTLTGGLPFFGGPGNEYSLHALAEMWSQIRSQPEAFAFINANGGVLSKHASGVFSCRPSDIDWTRADVHLPTDDLPRLERCDRPDSGTVVAYTVNYRKREPVQGIVLCETDDGRRFVSCTAPGDAETVQAMLNGEPAGQRVEVSAAPDKEHTLHFRLAPGPA